MRICCFVVHKARVVCRAGPGGGLLLLVVMGEEGGSSSYFSLVGSQPSSRTKVRPRPWAEPPVDATKVRRPATTTRRRRRGQSRACPGADRQTAAAAGVLAVAWSLCLGRKTFRSCPSRLSLVVSPAGGPVSPPVLLAAVVLGCRAPGTAGALQELHANGRSSRGPAPLLVVCPHEAAALHPAPEPPNAARLAPARPCPGPAPRPHRIRSAQRTVLCRLLRSLLPPLPTAAPPAAAGAGSRRPLQGLHHPQPQPQPQPGRQAGGTGVKLVAHDCCLPACLFVWCRA